MRQQHMFCATKSLHRCIIYKNVTLSNKTSTTRSLSTTRPVYGVGDNASASSKLATSPESLASPLTMENLADADITEINQIALETGSNTGLSFIGNNIMNTFQWMKSFFSSGESAYVWNDVVTHKLTHLYIPSIYEFVQYHSGISWFIVIGTGSLSLRFLLLPLTRRSMRFPTVVRTVIPQLKLYQDLIDVYTQRRDQERVKKLTQWNIDYMKKAGIGAVVPSLVVTSFIMVALNRGMRHLAHITPLMYGGIGPFVDMSVNSHSGVAFYFLPLCITSALLSLTHLNLRHEKWYNPRLSLVAIPVGGLFTYLLSAMPVTMTLHYAVSSWFTFFLNYCAHHESLRSSLKLPVPYKKPPPPVEIKFSKKVPDPIDNVFLSSGQTQERLSEKISCEEDFFKADDAVDTKKRFDRNAIQSERELLEEFIDSDGSNAGERKPLQLSTSYTPFFKLGQAEVEEDKSEEVVARDTFQPPPPEGGIMGQLSQMKEKFQFWKRFKFWYHRQKLMSHGKKRKMTMFLDEAPQETIFTREAIQLTTKVTPGLKRYVLRKQYPMDTLEELERKVSYMERVQGPRW